MIRTTCLKYVSRFERTCLTTFPTAPEFFLYSSAVLGDWFLLKTAIWKTSNLHPANLFCAGKGDLPNISCMSAKLIYNVSLQRLLKFQKLQGLYAHEDRRRSRWQVYPRPVQSAVSQHSPDDSVLFGQQAAHQGRRTHVSYVLCAQESLVICKFHSFSVCKLSLFLYSSTIIVEFRWWDVNQSLRIPSWIQVDENISYFWIILHWPVVTSHRDWKELLKDVYSQLQMTWPWASSEKFPHHMNDHVNIKFSAWEHFSRYIARGFCDLNLVTHLLLRCST